MRPARGPPTPCNAAKEEAAPHRNHWAWERWGLGQALPGLGGARARWDLPDARGHPEATASARGEGSDGRALP